MEVFSFRQQSLNILSIVLVQTLCNCVTYLKIFRKKSPRVNIVIESSTKATRQAAELNITAVRLPQNLTLYRTNLRTCQQVPNRNDIPNVNL